MSEEKKRPVFFDMVHSNNAARIRLWIRLKGLEDIFDMKMITYADLQSDEFKRVNPLKKVPSFITEGGDCIFESFVIMEYLEDKYGNMGERASFRLSTPEAKAYTNLLVRIHDIYIASPNNTQPGFSHTQGCMYLAPYETKFCAASRCMSRDTRAKKLAELWKQLNWLEQHVKGPNLCGDELTAADMTWFPTCVFMEFMLPRVFKWFPIFRETGADQKLPRLSAWYAHLLVDPVFERVRDEIWQFWVIKHQQGQFTSIEAELEDATYKWVYP
jgi:glutathione S-transferase